MSKVNTSLIKQSSKKEFVRDVLDSPRPVVVGFCSPRCPACRGFNPLLEQLAAEFAGQVAVVSLNIETKPALAKALDVSEVPTLMFFRDGRVIDRIDGAPVEPLLRRRMQQLTGDSILSGI
jgi:thioredoxin-like negative regulator of GroEL